MAAESEEKLVQTPISPHTSLSRSLHLHEGCSGTLLPRLDSFHSWTPSTRPAFPTPKRKAPRALRARPAEAADPDWRATRERTPVWDPTSAALSDVLNVMFADYREELSATEAGPCDCFLHIAPAICYSQRSSD